MEADIPAPASPPDPPQDQPGIPVPEYIAVVLHVVRHPARLRPPSARHCAPTRRCPHIPRHRGMLRHCQPLHHPGPPEPRHPARQRAAAFPARARRNRPRHQHRDPPHPHRRGATARASRPQPEQPAAPAATTKAPRPSLPPGSDDPELFMPTLEELERQVRRRAVGRTIAEILPRSRRRTGLLHPSLLERTVRGHALLRRQRRRP